MSDYYIAGQSFSSEDPALQSALADAHGSHQRPLCLCIPDATDPPEMYVARCGSTFIVKRMPFTGARHAPECPSYEPPEGLSGLGQVLGSAITEDPASGITTLKLDFPLMRMGSRTVDPVAAEGGDSAESDGTRLTLRGLLHYLWDQAGLARWQPGFAGKRSWGMVRRHLLQAAQGKETKGCALASRLFVPEVFSIAERDAIDARRRALWAQALQTAEASPGRTRSLMLLVGEVKEIAPARYGCRAVIKHMPDVAFALDDSLYGRLGRRFDGELALWKSSDAIHMVMIATFGLNGAGLPAIEALSLMPVTAHWLPVEDDLELQLVERLVRDRRRFTKGLRYNLSGKQWMATAILSDGGEVPIALFASRAGAGQPLPDLAQLEAQSQARIWLWQPSQSELPEVVGGPAST